VIPVNVGGTTKTIGITATRMALLDLQSFHNSAVAMNRLSAHPTATMPIVGTTGAGARVEPVESARNASLEFARIRASRTVPVNCVETTDAAAPVGSASKEKNALKVYAQLPIANPNALENSVVMTDAAASAVPVHLTKIATSLVNALKPLHVYPTASTNSVVRTDVAGNAARVGNPKFVTKTMAPVFQTTQINAATSPQPVFVTETCGNSVPPREVWER